MRRKLISLVGLAALCLTPAFASAQHAGFVLFGKPNEEGLSLAPERKAVAPISDPYYNEDSFVTTDLRAWYLYQSFPKSTALNGGHANVYACEVRLALTDTLQLVANKDGYADIDSPGLQESGWNDVAAGLKWNFLQDWKNNLHASLGAGYQFAIGDPGVLQNDQEVRVWGSVNKGFGALHLGATLNYIALVGNEGALGGQDRITWHAHADYYICKWFSPVVEFSGYFPTDRGDEVLPFSLADVGNIGGGSDLITFAPGFEIRPIDNLGVRVAYETDLTGGSNIYGYRWTFSLIYSF